MLYILAIVVASDVYGFLLHSSLDRYSDLFVFHHIYLVTISSSVRNLHYVHYMFPHLFLKMWD